MSETEPKINLNLGDTRFEATRDNTALYTFFGRVALYNHIFLKRDDLPEVPGGFQATYLFEDMAANTETYKRLEQLLIEKQFPALLNGSDPAECDIRAYMAIATQDMDSDTFPESWTE